VLQVVELFSAMREQSKDGNGTAPNNGRSLSSAAALTSLCADISPSSSHFFEVFIKVLIFYFYSFLCDVIFFFFFTVSPCILSHCLLLFQPMHDIYTLKH
jgi:hypothetical protein